MVIEKEIIEIEKMLVHFDVKNDAISKSGMDWHLDHTLRVIVATCSALKKSDPNEYQWSFNLPRIYVMTFGSIPRGKGKAPKVSFSETISKEVVLSLLEKSKKSLVEIETLSSKKFFQHPAFGKINLKTSKKFLKIHTEHHLKIMREIIQK